MQNFLQIILNFRAFSVNNEDSILVLQLDDSCLKNLMLVKKIASERV